MLSKRMPKGRARIVPDSSRSYRLSFSRPSQRRVASVSPRPTPSRRTASSIPSSETLLSATRTIPSGSKRRLWPVASGGIS